LLRKASKSHGECQSSTISSDTPTTTDECVFRSPGPTGTQRVVLRSRQTGLMLVVRCSLAWLVKQERASTVEAGQHLRAYVNPLRALSLVPGEYTIRGGVAGVLQDKDNRPHLGASIPHLEVRFASSASLNFNPEQG